MRVLRREFNKLPLVYHFANRENKYDESSICEQAASKKYHQLLKI